MMEVPAEPGDITCRKGDDNCGAKTKHNGALHLHVPSGSTTGATAGLHNSCALRGQEITLIVLAC